ncbi:MAG: hypothetical protein QF410_15495, partial [Planctomycetota bacterium]|nr:hypothetical protein [Planctomycetota bacterium]
MAERGELHAQLVGAAGARSRLDPCFGRTGGDDPKARLTGARLGAGRRGQLEAEARGMGAANLPALAEAAAPGGSPDHAGLVAFVHPPPGQ